MRSAKTLTEYPLNVIEKGMPSNGVITDNVGMFSITLKGSSNTLVVSRVGYATQEVKVSALGKELEITLAPRDQDLNQVLVVG